MSLWIDGYKHIAPPEQIPLCGCTDPDLSAGISHHGVPFRNNRVSRKPNFSTCSVGTNVARLNR